MFAQAVLDTSFLSLLQYTPAHAILRKIATQIDPEVEWLVQMSRLSGVLDPFVAAQKEKRERKNITKGDKGGVVLSKFEQKKEAQKKLTQGSVVVGQYALEELVW